MANGLYQTEGIIFNSQDQGEADKVLTIYTKEFGRVSNFIKRFSPGEGEEPKLWDAFWDFTRTGDELLFYAKALSILGYLDEKEIQTHSRENLAQLISGAIASSQL